MGAQGYSKLFLKLKFADYFRAETIQELLTYVTAGAHKATRVMTFWHGSECTEGKGILFRLHVQQTETTYFPFKSINQLIKF